MRDIYLLQAIAGHRQRRGLATARAIVNRLYLSAAWAVLTCATGVLAQPVASTPSSSANEAWIARVNQAEKEQQYAVALSICRAAESATQNAIDKRAARLCQARMLSLLGMFTDARQALDGVENPDPAMVQKMDEDVAAASLRQAELAYADTAQDKARAVDRALQLIAENRRRYPQSLRSRFDEIRALERREKDREALAAFAQLEREIKAGDIPAYVFHAAGLAYLRSHAPREALAALTRALERDPGNFEAALSRVNAYADLLDMESADMALAGTKKIAVEPGQKFEAEMLAIWLVAYQNRLAEAKRRFSALQDQAPNSDQLELALGRIAQWQDRPRDAEQHLSLVASRDPRNYQAHNGLRNVAAGVGDFGEAMQRLDIMKALEPEHADTVEAQRDWQLKRSFAISTTYSQSNDQSPRANGASRSLDSRFDLPYIGMQLRPYAVGQQEWHKFVDREATFRRTEAGLVYWWPWIGTMTLAARQTQTQTRTQTRAQTQSSRTTPFAETDLRLGDDISLALRYERDSADAPARARLDGIYARSIRAALRVRVADEVALRASAQELVFSDNNRRRSIGVGADFRLYAGARATIDASADAERTTNTSDAGAYFSPLEQNVASAAVSLNWLTSQWARGRFTQKLRVSASRVAQRGFAGEWAGNARYEHAWTISPAATLQYGVGYVRRVFDSEPSKGPEASISASFLF